MFAVTPAAATKQQYRLGVIILALFFHPPKTLDETTPHGDDVEPARA